MESLRRWAARAIALFVLLSASIFVSAESKILTEYPLPNASSGPLSVALVTDEFFFFTERSGDRIGFLDCLHNRLLEWQLSAGSNPHGIAISFRYGLVFFASQSGQIAAFNPFNNNFVVWQLPGNGPTPLHLAVVGNLVYYATQGTNVIGALNFKTNVTTEWAIPLATSFVNGLDVGGDGSVRVAEQFGHIIRLTPNTNQFKVWTIPLPANTRLTHLRVTPGGTFFGINSNQVARLNEKTNVLTEWVTPTTNSDIEDVQPLDTDKVAFSESTGNAVGILDTTIAVGVNTTVSATVSTVTPTVTQLTTQTSIDPPTVTQVTPVTTVVPAVSGGGFSVWSMPNAGSAPEGIAGGNDDDGDLVFTEQLGNRVGVLQETDD